LRDAGKAVIVCTHRLDEAERLCDRFGLLHHGRLLHEGTLAELKALLPSPTVEYVEKQPTLEEIFLAVIGHDATGTNATSTEGSPS